MTLKKEAIHRLTIRFNLDPKQRAELSEIIDEISKVEACSSSVAAEKVRQLMENKHNSIVDIRKIYGIEKLFTLKEYNPDDAS
ncbi:hypothetical protein ACFHWD_18645 [Clostridium sp. MT-14]|uniref:hypothetical protein n=1 Tax=unclassified Clostridium TaxID=2614128 RepID=UPI00123A1232|nr:hypothetical protein [Clostridium sp. HV4-5-A1G]KAA8668986.1 hypothetical protein F3O63_13725 [Clostridium sp. HV4-5-A1G]CAB1249668.1 hypothetical protein CLOSBL3_11925 [Clostridiaceae bacterium BL-3]